LSLETFRTYLRPLRRQDWSNNGPFRGFGGRRGAHEVYQHLARRLFVPQLRGEKRAG
jgi:hypothetical protein